MEANTKPHSALQPVEAKGNVRDLVVVGASAGGIPAIATLLAGLPDDLPAAVLIALHLAPDSGAMLPAIFAKRSLLPVAFAEDGLPLLHGEVRLAPTDHHLVVQPGRMRVVRGPRENRFRPAVDPLFRSAAWAYGARVIGVLLSGMLNDGTAGLWTIRTCGGLAVVQDPGDARFSDMPRHALENLPVDHCLPVADIGSLLASVVRKAAPNTEKFAPSAQVAIETKMASQTADGGVEEMSHIGRLSPFTCPSCHGSLWEVFDDYVLRFRCHTGHAFSADSLDAAQREEYENALFSALRLLEENAALSRSVADRVRSRGQQRIARIYDEKANEADRTAEVIRRMLLGANSARAKR